MNVQRQQIGEAIQYKGRDIVVRHMGPDLLCFVDGQEVGNFYIDRPAAIDAGVRYIDQIEKEAKK
jgi:hypothetical protein